MAGTSEIAGGLGLALGLFTPVAAAAMIGTMTTAGFVNNADGGFWSVRKGWELNGYLVVVATAVAITGPGVVSLTTRWAWTSCGPWSPGGWPRFRGRVRRWLAALGHPLALTPRPGVP